MADKIWFALTIAAWLAWFPVTGVSHAPAPDPVSWDQPRVVVRTQPPSRPDWGTFCGAIASVRVDYYRPQMMAACQAVDEVWQEYGARAIVTGHGREQAYEYERLHRIGLAADFRIYNLRNGQYQPVAREAARFVCVQLRETDPRFRLVLFLGKPGKGDHIHVEWRDEEEISWPEAFWQGDEEACP